MCNSFYTEYPPKTRRMIHLNYLVDKVIFCWIINGNTSYSWKIPVDIKNWWNFGLNIAHTKDDTSAAGWKSKTLKKSKQKRETTTK